MSLSGSERSSHSDIQQQQQHRQSRPSRRKKLFRKRDKRSRSSERYDFSDLEDDVFVRGPRKLRREDVEGELSYDYANPGHLKVFTAGLNRCAGLPEFRTIVVSAVDTAADVIHEVLQRCDILYGEGDEFFLCEVIGKLEPYQPNRPGASQFVEQCRRIIGPEEHVLVIQALWKPLYGYYRRFELQQVSPGDANGEPSSTTTRRRRVRLWRTGGADFFRHFDIDINDDDNNNSSDDGELQGRAKPSGSVGAGRSVVTCQQEAATQVEPGDPPAKRHCRPFGTQTETVYFASADKSSRKKYPVPLGPYLLLLKGFDSRHDLLVNDLFDTNLLGSDDRRCDIHLRCADVLPEHCVIEACHSDAADGDSGRYGGPAKSYCMSVAPIAAAEVLLNGLLIDRKQFLAPGDVISIGAGELCSYVFVFKDASQTPDRSIGLTWLLLLEAVQRSLELQQHLQQPPPPPHQHHRPATSGSLVASTTVPSDSVLDTPRNAASSWAASETSDSRREADAQQLAEAGLASLLALYFGEAVDLQLTAGMLIMLAVYVTDLSLERASAEIQWHLTDAAVTLSKKASQMSDPRDKSQCYGEMIQAGALAFEIFLFFHEVCSGGGDERGGRGGGVGLTRAAVRCQQWHEFCEATMQQMLDNIFSQLGEAILTESAALSDTGVYPEPQSQRPSSCGPEVPTMESFITLLTQVSQAFATERYPCLCTLRLMVLKRLIFQVAKTFTQRMFGDDSSTAFKWSSAVQLRVNLDQLEEWLRQEGLSQFLMALDLANSLVDLMATPKAQLMTMSWQVLRNTFPIIPASLMRRALQEYESRSGPVTGAWRVSPEDCAEAEYNATCAIEDHFQAAIEDCQIPVEEARPSVRLDQLLRDAEFAELIRHLDKETGASNCRLKWHQVAQHVRQRFHNSDHDGPPTLGGLFSSELSRASTVASSTVAPPEPEEGAIFYDSLSDNTDKDEEAAASAAGIATVAEHNNPGDQQPRRPETPTPLHPFASLAFDNDDGGDSSSGGNSNATPEEYDCETMDSRTLRNTIRNEMLAHRLHQRSSNNGYEGEEDEELEENNSTMTSSTAAANSALYSQHTASFVVPVAEADDDEQQPPPPPPPPRSCSLNSRASSCGQPTTVVQSSQSLGGRQGMMMPVLLGKTKTAGENGNHGDEEEEVFFVTLTRTAGQSFGLELIDGEKTDLAVAGIFIRSLVPGTPAGGCGRLNPGDRIIAVNSQSLVKQPYARCLGLIKQSESLLQLLVARPRRDVAKRILAATAC